MKHAKVTTRIFVVLAMVLILSACGEVSTSTYTASEMAQVVLATQPDSPNMQLLDESQAQFSQYAFDFYHIDTHTIIDGAVLYGGGMEADEMAVLIFSGNSEAQTAQENLQDYIVTREGDFVGYAPDEAVLVADGEVVRSGSYVALLICEDTSSAREAFLACFGESPPPLEDLGDKIVITEQGSTTLFEQRQEDSQSMTEWIFDDYAPRSIIEAWNSGETDGLSPKNMAIYEACVEVIDEVITEDMSDYEKELAIYDWILHSTSYDSDYTSQAPNANPDPDNNNPYGLLINHKAICTGYTYTFQLFMDLLGIDCVSVEGTTHRGTEEHDWNVVKLDGDWYCVDLTWSDSAGTGRRSYTYFNVTSDMLREYDHQWDESNVPEANGTAYRMR